MATIIEAKRTREEEEVTSEPEAEEETGEVIGEEEPVKPEFAPFEFSDTDIEGPLEGVNQPPYFDKDAPVLVKYNDESFRDVIPKHVTFLEQYKFIELTPETPRRTRAKSPFEYWQMSPRNTGREVGYVPDGYIYAKQSATKDVLIIRRFSVHSMDIAIKMFWRFEESAIMHHPQDERFIFLILIKKQFLELFSNMGFELSSMLSDQQLVMYKQSVKMSEFLSMNTRMTSLHDRDEHLVKGTQFMEQNEMKERKLELRRAAGVRAQFARIVQDISQMNKAGDLESNFYQDRIMDDHPYTFPVYSEFSQAISPPDLWEICQEADLNELISWREDSKIHWLHTRQHPDKVTGYVGFTVRYNPETQTTHIQIVVLCPLEYRLRTNTVSLLVALERYARKYKASATHSYIQVDTTTPWGSFLADALILKPRENFQNMAISDNLFNSHLPLPQDFMVERKKSLV